MKKELCAILTILLLFVGGIGNLIHLNSLMEQITSNINYAKLYCSLEDYAAAHKETTKTMQLWKSSENYTKIFIRQSEIDSIYDILYDTLSAIEDREKYEADYLLQKLQYHADNLLTMEQISINSVF